MVPSLITRTRRRLSTIGVGLARGTRAFDYLGIHTDGDIGVDCLDTLVSRMGSSAVQAEERDVIELYLMWLSWVISHMNELSYVSYEWVFISYEWVFISYEWVFISYGWDWVCISYEWVISHVNSSNPICISHVSFEVVVSHMNRHLPPARFLLQSFPLAVHPALRCFRLFPTLLTNRQTEKTLRKRTRGVGNFVLPWPDFIHICIYTYTYIYSRSWCQTVRTCEYG